MGKKMEGKSIIIAKVSITLELDVPIQRISHLGNYWIKHKT